MIPFSPRIAEERRLKSNNTLSPRTLSTQAATHGEMQAPSIHSQLNFNYQELLKKEADRKIHAGDEGD